MSKNISNGYSIGQVVRLKRDVYGHIDPHYGDFIPKDTPCTILGIYCQPEPMVSSISYRVLWDEWGRDVIAHVDLKP